MFKELRPVLWFVAILATALITIELVFSIYDINNYRLKSTEFDVYVVSHEYMEQPKLVIRGSKFMSWGRYAISFEVLDKANISLKDEKGKQHKKWLTQYFTKNATAFYYDITNCPNGEHVIKVDIARDTFSRTFYIPFNKTH